jgi:hypothetical protein
MGASALLLASAARSDRSGGGCLSASLNYNISVLLSRRVNINLPATAWSFTALKDANELERLFFGQGIDRDGTGWTSTNDCDSFYCHHFS